MSYQTLVSINISLDFSVQTSMQMMKNGLKTWKQQFSEQKLLIN